MSLELYWAAASPWCWRVRLALAWKGLDHGSHLLDPTLQAHKAPPMLRMNPRGRLPVLLDGDYVVFESVAVLYYLDRRNPEPPLFGRGAQEGAVILRVIEEFQAYIEPHLTAVCAAVAAGTVEDSMDALVGHMVALAGEARTIEGRLSKSDWIVGDQPSAADFVLYPGIRFLEHALEQRAAAALRSRFLPVGVHYPALARWFARVDALPGIAATRPPHWPAAS